MSDRLLGGGEHFQSGFCKTLFNGKTEIAGHLAWIDIQSNLEPVVHAEYPGLAAEFFQQDLWPRGFEDLRMVPGSLGQEIDHARCGLGVGSSDAKRKSTVLVRIGPIGQMLFEETAVWNQGFHSFGVPHS
jgi:hypothetical protein